MLTKKMIRTASCVALSLGAVALVGCSKEAATPTPSPTPTSAASTAADDKAIEAILVKADLVDGNADHLVSKCAGCQLAMDGAKEHGIKAGKYKLLFCSGDCKNGFAKDLNQSILALHVPGD